MDLSVWDPLCVWKSLTFSKANLTGVFRRLVSLQCGLCIRGVQHRNKEKSQGCLSTEHRKQVTRALGGREQRRGYWDHKEGLREWSTKLAPEWWLGSSGEGAPLGTQEEGRFGTWYV